MFVPEEYGGAGLTYLAYVVAIEEGAGKDWQHVGEKLAKHRNGETGTFVLPEYTGLR